MTSKDKIVRYREVPFVSLREIIGHDVFNKFVIEQRYKIFQSLDDPQKFIVRLRKPDYEILEIRKHKVYEDIITVEPVNPFGLRRLCEVISDE